MCFFQEKFHLLLRNAREAMPVLLERCAPRSEKTQQQKIGQLEELLGEPVPSNNYESKDKIPTDI